MKNIDETATYTFFDHAFSNTVRSLSHVVGLRKITQPFWARWLASGVSREVIFRFLDQLGSIDGWARIATRVVDEEISQFEAIRDGLTASQRIAALRVLSYLANMAQWGSLPITDERRALYRKCRDYYIAAETAAYPSTFRRVDAHFEGMVLHANLHVPEFTGSRSGAPLVVIVHGVDGCKEEFLSTELALLEAGFAVVGFDGPGQGETLLLDGQHWRPTFSKSVSALLNTIGTELGVDTSRTGILGISVGGLWALQTAADDDRVLAVYDLGGLINTMNRFAALPFLIKTRICQVTGRHDTLSVKQALSQINIEDNELLKRIRADVRSMHGTRDRVVSIADKEWLLAKLTSLRPGRSASLRLLEGGDHCCTGHATEVRSDMIAFLTATLRPTVRAGAPSPLPIASE
jgi:pimeloyl-ACP methyl ester carboxylesterase